MFATLVLTLATAYAPRNAFAATPTAAAFLALTPPKSGKHVLVRINRAGRYATILTRGDSMEGGIVTSPILVEKFSFGWQPLEILNFRCSLDGRAIAPADRRALMAGMPKPAAGRGTCATDAKDFGAPARVEAVRMLMRGPLIPYVNVSGNFAKGDWYGAGGGETLFRKDGTAWTVVEGGGGVMGTNEMIAHHVPRSSWCELAVYGATCPTVVPKPAQPN